MMTSKASITSTSQAAGQNAKKDAETLSENEDHASCKCEKNVEYETDSNGGYF